MYSTIHINIHIYIYDISHLHLSLLLNVTIIKLANTFLSVVISICTVVCYSAGKNVGKTEFE